MKISIKYKFLIPTVCLLLMGMGIVSIVSHLKSKQALTKVIVDEIDNVAKTTVNSMSSWINDRTLDIENWSKQGIYQKALLNSFLGLTARTFANEQLDRIKQDYKYYEDIALADNSGDIIAASNSEVIGKVNISDRVYFQKAQAGNVYITEHVVISKVTGKRVFMISAPVKDKEQVVGVLFAVFDVNDLSGKFIDSITIGKTGFAYFFLDRGFIVCNKKCRQLSFRNINEFGFGRQMVKNKEGIINYDLGGAHMTASYRKVKKINWTVVVSAVDKELFLPVQTLGRINAFVTIVVAVIVGFIIVMVTLTISRPIKQVVDGLRQMGEGRLDFRLTLKNHDEIGRIGQALNRMAHNLEISNRKIKQQNRLLTRARDELELRVDQRTFELRQAEKNYREIFENAVEGIFQATLDGYIINANPSMAKILGYKDVSDMFSRAEQVLFPVSVKEGKKLRKLLENKGKVVAYETRLKRQDGRRFWCSVSVSKIYNEENQYSYCEGFVVDITERREKEIAQREYKAAQAANHAKSEFLANMSHEIRTPLNTLLGFSELLAVDLNDPRQESYIKAMRISGNSLLTLINDILDLSKIEAGKMVFKYEPVNFKILCSEMQYIFKDKMDKKGLGFKVIISDQLPDELLFDETRMRQILLNLVGNAVKFTDKGQITIKVDVIQSKGDTIDFVIHVKDTGPGIKLNDHTAIFESFKQLDGQTTRQYGGTGLGLAICRRLTLAMNGELTVASKVGIGSTFTVLFKDVKCSGMKKVSKILHPDPEKQSAVSFEKKRILIVDDIESNRVMLKELLIRFNQDVIEAENGQTAVDLAKEQMPDLIIMDIRMPVMDGNEATRLLKADPETQKIPIIAFTGDVVAKTKTGALKKGYDGYLTKPVKIWELTDELTKYIQFKKQNKDKRTDRISWDDFSKDQVKEPQIILSVLRNDILPASKTYKHNIVISQVREFCVQLNRLSKKHHINPLTVFTDQLIESVNLFDITRIEKKMGELPQFLEELIQHL